MTAEQVLQDVLVVVDALTSPVEPPFTAAGSLRHRGQDDTM